MTLGHVGDDRTATLAPLMQARLLALDTSTERLALALGGPGGPWLLNEPGGARASSRLLAAVQELLAAAQIDAPQLDAIAFGAGPGAFTGLRTACAVAQGLALGLGRPVIAIDSLLVVAEDALRQQPAGAPGSLWVAMDARMDEVYAASYRRTGGRWHTASAPALWTLDALSQAWLREPPEAVAGSAIEAFGARLPSGAAARFPVERDRATALLALAEVGWRQGALRDAADALPVYLRDKVALTRAERDAARAGRSA